MKYFYRKLTTAHEVIEWCKANPNSPIKTNHCVMKSDAWAFVNYDCGGSVSYCQTDDTLHHQNLMCNCMRSKVG